jgi:predicted permease
MRWLRKLPLRWRSLARRQALDRDLDEELRYHLEREIEELVARGQNRADARLAVLRRFGGVQQVKERCRETRGVEALDTLVRDLRHATRVLARNPGFAAVAVLTLALGIGVNSAVFSLVDGILLSRLPYPASDRLVSITGRYPGGGLVAMREEIRTFDAAAYAEGHTFTLAGRGGEPIRVTGARVSAELFSLLGAGPQLGRWFRPGEDLAGRDQYVVLSHALWETRFERDQAVVGRSVEIDGLMREVVAVMPASFQFPSQRTQIWVPLGLDAGNPTAYWASDFMPVVGRLRPGTTMSQAHGEIRAFQSRIGARFPWRMPADWNRDVAVIPLQDALVGDVRPRLLIMIAAVAVVLVIACANVANLNLSRALAREREIAIRTAIGAGPRHIAQQLLTESVVVAVLGALAGLAFATQALSVLTLVLPADTPRLAEVHLNWRVLAFTAGVAVVTGCAFGLAPVLQSLRLRVRTALESGPREGSRPGAGRLRAALTIAQVACAVLLVIAAGLMVRSLWSLSGVDPGFRTDEVVTARVAPAASVCDTPERCLAFYRAFDAEVQAAPGVRGAALVNTLPLTGAIAKRSLELEGYRVPDSRTAPLFWMHVVTPDYFRVMDIRLDSGRGFVREDLTGREGVAIVSSSTARRFWPGQSPIGRRVRFVGEDPWHTIVGVVSDVRAHDLTRTVPDWIDGTVYVPHGPNATMESGRIASDMSLAVQTTMEAAQVAALVRAAAAEISGGVVIGEVRTMRAVVADAVAAPAATASVMVTAAGLALSLGCVGVYGVLSFLVSRRTRDLGIRLALGASRQDVFWLVIREGATLCVAGIAIGVAGAMALTRWLSSELHGISPTDPATYGAVVFAVSIVTLAACYVPTRRAMGVDPLIVMREQ